MNLISARLLRCTWQLVASEDYHWIRQLIYDKSLSVMNGWTSSMGFKFSDMEKDHMLSTVEKVVGERGVATEEEITDALLREGIPKDHLLYNHHLRMAELEGLVCSGPLGPRSTYMLVKDRVGAFTYNTLISAVVALYSFCLAIASACVRFHSDKPSNLHPNGD